MKDTDDTDSKGKTAKPGSAAQPGSESTAAETSIVKGDGEGRPSGGAVQSDSKSMTNKSPAAEPTSG